MIRVLLADDQSLVRAGLRVLVDCEEDIEVAGEARDGEEAVALALSTAPDVVLMDIQMPGIGGVEATRLIAADGRLDAVKVVMLTTFDTDENIFETLRAGASGFLLKDSDPADLLRGIRVVASGEALLAPSVTRKLIADFASRPESPETTPDDLRWLTEREREVMALVAAGPRHWAPIAVALTASRAPPARRSTQRRLGRSRTFPLGTGERAAGPGPQPLRRRHSTGTRCSSGCFLTAYPHASPC